MLASALLPILVQGIATFGRSDHSTSENRIALGGPFRMAFITAGFFKGRSDAFHLQPGAMLINGI